MKGINKHKLMSILILTFACFILLELPFKVLALPNDISKHWAKEDIKSAAVEGWAYVENGKFKPDKSATREEVIWMLIGACKTVKVKDFDIAKKVDLKNFKDKPSTWAQSRMAIAIANNLIKGYSDKTIKPKASITRAELSVLLARKLDKSMSKDFCKFWDYIPDWALEAIKNVASKGIVKGYKDGTFKPNANVSKAEALVMIKRWKALMPPIPKPLSKEFKDISKNLKGIEISDDNKSLSYFGEKVNKTDSTKDKFKIMQGDATNFTLIIKNDIDDEGYSSLSDALKVILPTGYSNTVNEIKSVEENKETKLNLDGKFIKIRNLGMQKILEISNTQFEEIIIEDFDGE